MKWGTFQAPKEEEEEFEKERIPFASNVAVERALPTTNYHYCNI